jgi:hypothetical protein
MVRYRLHGEIEYGKFREALDIWKQLAELTIKRGWPKLTIWSPVVGHGNLMIIESDYPDMATWERVNGECLTDAEFMGLFRQSAAYVTQGSSFDELLTASPDLA